MKLTDFKNQLKAGVEKICQRNKWDFQNVKQRGMAFEDWCFELLNEKFPTADNDRSQAILRTDDGGNDIIFEAAESQEAFIVQCKFPNVAQQNVIPEEDVKHFFTNFSLLKDKSYIKQRGGKNQRLSELSNEVKYWIENNWTINFVFISTDTRGQNIEALIEKFNRDYANESYSVKFDVWDLAQLKDVWAEVQSVTETYPDLVKFTLADDHYMLPEGRLENITFAVRGTELQTVARRFKESLFNWNIRRYLGKKGEVNKGLLKTIEDEPESFYYYNNGISALCEDFDFDDSSKRLTVKKIQIVNGAQTIGAIQISDPNKLKDVLVLVKLTQVKHFNRETGVSAELIRTNNTQNKLSLPDFRSNDKIQLWLEHKFKETKSRGDFLQIDYGRKKPYPRSSANKQVLKLQELGKIRFAWLADPRIPISDPASLFALSSEKGLYGTSFGNGGQEVDYWTEDQFRETLLAIHCFNKLSVALAQNQESNPELKQITRLKYYALKLFKTYWDDATSGMEKGQIEDLFRFGEKFNSFYQSGELVIVKTLRQAYKEILNREEGTAFSLPRDQKVWDLVQSKFSDNLEFVKEMKLGN